MAITIDWSTYIISVPQGDLSLVSGTLYELDTETTFRAAVNALLASEEGIVFDDAISHNTDYSVVGVNYARKIEVLSPYSVLFTPDSQWSVRLAGSNNNLFDVEGGILQQNQVQVIPQNSAGLIQITSGSGLSVDEQARLLDIWRRLGLDSANPLTTTPDAIDAGPMHQDVTGDGSTSTTVTRNDP